MWKPVDDIGRILLGIILNSRGKFKVTTLLNNFKVYQYRKTICGLYLEIIKCDIVSYYLLIFSIIY